MAATLYSTGCHAHTGLEQKPAQGDSANDTPEENREQAMNQRLEESLGDPKTQKTSWSW